MDEPEEHADSHAHDDDVKVAPGTPPGMGPLRWYEKIYLPEVVKGLANTLKHMFVEEPFTTQYPEEPFPVNPRARGEHILKTDEQGREKCVACLLCEAACPAKCIRIVPAPSPWADRERYPVEFEIDMLRCIYCAFCEEACPCDAIELTPKPYQVYGSREEFLYKKEKLKTNFPQDWRQKIAGGYGKREGAPFKGEQGVKGLIR